MSPFPERETSAIAVGKRSKSTSVTLCECPRDVAGLMNCVGGDDPLARVERLSGIERVLRSLRVGVGSGIGETDVAPPTPPPPAPPAPCLNTDGLKKVCTLTLERRFFERLLPDVPVSWEPGVRGECDAEEGEDLAEINSSTSAAAAPGALSSLRLEAPRGQLSRGPEIRSSARIRTLLETSACHAD
jgi:hypothetical protein